MVEPRFIIAHPDGRRFSVTREAFEQLYEPEGFAIEGPETGAAFTGALGRAEQPARPRRQHRRRRAAGLDGEGA